MKTASIKGYFMGFLLLFVSLFVNGDGMPKEKGSPSAADANEMNFSKQEKKFVKNYIRNNRRKLYAIKQRSRSPFAITDSIFSKYGLPVQLKYLAVIESELKAKAVSRVGAVGPWQLMPETAKILGLKISHSSDERTQYYKSTRAAAKYLRDLHGEFGDWLLVLAAYNGGPGAVYHAMRMSGSRNFWDLQSYLPAESRMHVKKFIASLYYFEGQESVTAFTRTGPVPFQMVREPRDPWNNWLPVAKRSLYL
jgi:membrane-bound lytic murein transglycosylase D